VSHTPAMAWVGAVGAVRLPVVALPVGRTPGGLPVGVQVIGPALSDLRLLALADRLDAVAGGYATPPGY
jgi:amidase